jgi:phosphocarrier protein HPr
MAAEQGYTAKLVIKNPLGFHVRPIQRFVELARAFRGDIQVEINDRRASGKSVMGLMSLGGRHGSTMTITTDGEDAKQALELLRFLVESDFFVEDGLDASAQPDRHIGRLARFASCFHSQVWLQLGEKRVPADDFERLRTMDVTPTSQIAFDVKGADGEQARQVLNSLIKNRFYVEDEMGDSDRQKAK